MVLVDDASLTDGVVEQFRPHPDERVDQSHQHNQHDDGNECCFEEALYKTTHHHPVKKHVHQLTKQLYQIHVSLLQGASWGDPKNVCVIPYYRLIINP